MPRRRKKHKAQNRDEITVFNHLEQGPIASQLAAGGWPPVQFTLRMQHLIEGMLPESDLDIPSPRAVQVMQGTAAAVAGRVGDQSVAASLREQLEQFDEVLSLAEGFFVAPATGEPPAVLRAWELLAYASGALSYLQQPDDPMAYELAAKRVSLSIAADQLAVVVREGGLAPDILAALLPAATGASTELPFPQAAEACFFLAIAVIDGPPEAKDALLKVTEHLADRLDALRPQDSHDSDANDAPPQNDFGFQPTMNPPKSRSRKTSPVRTGNWYQVKITLNGIKPPIWRRIVIPDCTLAELDAYVRLAMGWDGGHLSSLEIDGETYSAPNPFTDELLDDTEDGRQYTLGQFVQQGTKKFRHDYDFGDGWEHAIVVEKVVSQDQAPTQPTCLDGARACPPEDCGGVYGYYDLLEALKNPKLPDSEEKLEWLGGDWDPESFNAKSVFSRLR